MKLFESLIPIDQILLGDVIDRIREIPDRSVHCVITSPPYYSMRDYGTAGQIGLENSIPAYIAKIILVCREIRRVLRPEGTFWLNMGDSYNGSNRGGNAGGKSTLEGSKDGQDQSRLVRVRPSFRRDRDVRGSPPMKGSSNLKPKDLIGMPWRIAFALQADGWWLRSDIIWHKKQAMPETVKDRPTKAHEYLFLLTKSERYYYDAFAIREPSSLNTHARGNGVGPKANGARPSNWQTGPGDHRASTYSLGRVKQNGSFSHAVRHVVSTRNKRSVWSLSSQPLKEAHFAAFPEALVQPCILAGTSEKGCCASCSAPWMRKMEKPLTVEGIDYKRDNPFPVPKMVGWVPTCRCKDPYVRPAIVMDPFMGSGTVAIVAIKTGRRYIGIELNPEYIQIAKKRIDGIKAKTPESKEVVDVA